jgi:hypothetical protein
LTTWGCGTTCLQYAIIDARTGRIYPAPFSPEAFSICCWTPGFGFPDNTVPIEFRLDSSLIVFHGMRNENDRVGDYYYAMGRTGLRLIRVVDEPWHP